MKRKNESEEPKQVKKHRYGDETPYWESSVSFDKLGLEPRLLQSIVKQKFSSPTPIQARAIPLALEGKNIIGM
jgi:ATP-dependent RNA helicase DDX56/DBP9